MEGIMLIEIDRMMGAHNHDDLVPSGSQFRSYHTINLATSLPKYHKSPNPQCWNGSSQRDDIAKFVADKIEVVMAKAGQCIAFAAGNAKDAFDS